MNKFNLWVDSLFEKLVAKDIRFAEDALKHGKKQMVIDYLKTEKGQESFARNYEVVEHCSKLLNLALTHFPPDEKNYKLYPQKFSVEEIYGKKALSIRSTFFHPLKEPVQSLFGIGAHLQ